MFLPPCAFQALTWAPGRGGGEGRGRTLHLWTFSFHSVWVKTQGPLNQLMWVGEVRCFWLRASEGGRKGK